MSVEALSLASNIINLIDFGQKFYQSFREIYEKHKLDSTAEAKADNLLLLAEKLKDSRKKAQQTALKNDQLFQVADKCVKAATDLHQEIAKLALPGASSRAPHGVQSLVSAAKRTWRHKRMEQLKKSLDDCQATMQNTILFKMYESGEAEQVRRLEGFGKLEFRLQSFVQAISKQELQMSELLVENQSLHQETQIVLRQEVAKLKIAQDYDAELARLKTSLKFPGLNQRYNKLRPAHSKSFQWLLGDHSIKTHESSHDEPKYLKALRAETFGDFQNWLRNEPDSKLYWVSGKPGAGKSTLMKYLFNQIEKTNVIDSPYLVLHHFFWLGTTNERSKHNDMEGMFMTILCQLLEQDIPGISLASTLIQNIPRISQKDHHTDWSLSELKDTTQQALQLISSRYSIYLLLDALDEHLPVAHHDELLQVVTQLEKMPKVRLVVSSRREMIFDKRLSGARQLHLQKLTAPDIYYFALDSLSKSIGFQDPLSTRFLDDTVQRIVQKADGVFLWARLAVDSIKRGLIHGNALDELYDRLNDMPAELYDYFKFIWNRLGDDRKRYQTRAANIFSLLCCKSWDRVLLDQGYFGPLNHMTAGHLDLLYLSLALNPTYAQRIVQGDGDINETALLELCEGTETIILSSCAGLVELQGHSEGPEEIDYCIPCNVEPMVFSRRYGLIHRTAREFLRETVEGKHILISNDLGKYGPDFRVLLAALARSTLFREPRQVTRRCLPKRRLVLGQFFSKLRSNQYSESPLSIAQRYLLLDLCHQVYYRFSGHLENPEFQTWRLIRSSDIYPFVVIAAYSGQGDYVAQWLKAQASGGRTFSAEFYAMVSRADLDARLDMPNVSLMLFDVDPCFGAPGRLNDLLPHGIIYPIYRYSTDWMHSQPLNMQTALHQLLFPLLGTNEHQSERAEELIFMIKHIVDLVHSSGFDPLATIPLTFIGKGFTGSVGSSRWMSLHYPHLAIRRTKNTDSMDLERVHMIYETNPLWVIQYVARVCDRLPGAEGLCLDLMEFVHSHGQNGRKIQKPQPALLFKAEVDDFTLRHSLPVVIREMRKVRSESKRLLDGLDQDDFLKWPLQRMWDHLPTNVLDEAQIEELLVAHRLWCSWEDLKQLRKKCDILIAGQDAPADEHENGYERFIIPPEGCSAEQQALSFLTMRLTN
ncbi:hypothetical protein G7054_g10526 [Neopestalotiopsis clavispora]|nr:hypothetical protein G7054_g10526 [Neopestalotiopsis clavispora]